MKTSKDKQPASFTAGISEIKNFSEIAHYGRVGLLKEWIWQSKSSHNLSCNVMEKMRFSIEDLNKMTKDLTPITMEKLIYCIALVDWLTSGLYLLEQTMYPAILKDFNYKFEDEYNTAIAFFRAIRSFVLAHPLETNRHPNYEFDGKIVCSDFRSPDAPLIKASPKKAPRFYYLDTTKQREFTDSDNPDFYLLVHRKEAGDYTLRYIGCNLSLIFNVAHITVHRIYALDEFLKTVTQKKYKSKSK